MVTGPAAAEAEIRHPVRRAICNAERCTAATTDFEAAGGRASEVMLWGDEVAVVTNHHGALWVRFASFDELEEAVDELIFRPSSWSPAQGLLPGAEWAVSAVRGGVLYVLFGNQWHYYGLRRLPGHPWEPLTGE